MEPTDKYTYENVVPSKNKNFSTNLNFNDKNDLFELDKKKSLIEHTKKINTYTLTIVLIFFSLLVMKISILFQNQ